MKENNSSCSYRYSCAQTLFLILSHSNYLSLSLILFHSISFSLSFSLLSRLTLFLSLSLSLSLSLTLALALATLLKCELIVDTMLQNSISCSKKLRECPMLCVIHINDLIIFFFFLSSNIHK